MRGMAALSDMPRSLEASVPAGVEVFIGCVVVSGLLVTERDDGETLDGLAVAVSDPPVALVGPC